MYIYTYIHTYSWSVVNIHYGLTIWNHLQMHAKKCPSILEGTVSQTSYYKDSKIKH